MAAALVAAAIVALGAASTLQAYAADDDGSATSSADIVLVVPDDGSGGGGSEGSSGSGSGGSATRAASTKTGDPIAWGSLLAVAVLAAGVAAFARRQVASGGNSGAVAVRASHSASRADGRPSVNNRSAVRKRPSAYSRPGAHARTGSHAKRRALDWGRIGVVALAVALVALVASSVMVFSARAASNDTIRIEMQKAADGTYSGTTTYYLNNDATYYRQLAKITETENAGYSISDGSITITIAPASDPSDDIVSPDAVKGATTSGGTTWRMPGSAVSADHALALKVTATAKTLKVGDNEVGTATFDMTAPPYEDLKVRLSTAPVVGKPLTANVSGAPEEATNTFTYAWLCSDDDGKTWKEIPGATASTYTPTTDMAGKRISISLACANPAWFVVSPSDYGSVAPTCPAPAEGQHIVQFDVGDHGSAPAAQVVDDAANATRPDDPSETGYTFGGWFADEECTQEFSFTTPITEDITLYALWIPGSVGTYTIVHLQQGLDDPATYAEVDRDVKTGEFSGQLSDIARTYAGFTATHFERDASASGGLVLNVYYDRKVYTITFHANGDIYETAQITYGAKAVKPATDPTATGKDFSCWSRTEGSDTAYDFDTPVTGDIDLYARFATQVFTVTFETWGQTPKPDDQQVEYGETATEPASPVAGQGSPEFKGWYADDAYLTPFNFATPIMQDTTVYAKYSPNVLVDFQGKAKNVSFPKAYDSTFAESELAGVSAPGYDIVDDKWYQDAGFTTKWSFPITVNDDKVIYPKLSARTDTPYQVKHYLADLTGGGYTLDDTEDKTGTTATDTAAAAKAYDGFTSEGTTKGGDGTIEQKAIAGDRATVVEIYYKRNTDTLYTVQHWLQNTTDDDYTHDTGADQTLTGTTGDTTAAVAKTYAGFTALAITQGTIAGDGSTVVNVYYDRAKYTVTYDVQGHGDTPDPVTGVRHGSTLASMPASTATGYTFEGWYKDANCSDGQKWNAGTDMVTSDITLYAKWTGRPYTIKFMANSDPEGSAGTMADLPAVVGTSTTLTANAFTRAGYTFAGWDTAADGTGTHYDDGASSSTFSEDGTDVVLYAQWIGNAGIQYKVEHYLEEGFGVGTYNLKETDNLTGTAGTLTAAAAKTTSAYDDYVCSGTTQGGDGTIDQEAIKGDGTTVIKIYYKQGVCKVTFQAWGQTVSGDNPQRVAHGGKATEPTTPTLDRGNPKFGGWFTDPAYATAYDFNTAVTSDITLYGKFTPSVTVKFMLWDGASAGDEVGTASIPLAMAGEPASATLEQSDLNGAVVPAGYTLSGTDFYEDAACSNVLSVPKSGISDDSVVVYALVTANTDTPYKVEHYQQSISDESSYELVDTDNLEGTTAADTAATAKAYSGFTLEGTTKGGSGTITQTAIAGDGSTVVAIYYKRDTVNYTVEHYQQNLTGEGYTIVSGDTETKLAKTGASTEAVAKTTYTGFAAKPFSQETVAGNGSTVVKVYYDRETYTVTFHANGHGTAPEAQTVRYGGTPTQPTDPSETGYDFGGWYQEEGCTTAFDFSQAITGNEDAYAKWTIQRFVVSFVVNEVMAAKPGDQTVDYGGHATSPGNVAKTGHHLIGWFKDAGYTTPFDFATELIRATTSVYGSFAADTYTVAYDANDGSAGSTVSNLPSDQTKTYGVDLTLSSATPTRQPTPSGTRYTVTYNGNGGAADKASDTAAVQTSYTFAAWDTVAAGGGTAYAAGATYTANEGATLYAQWAEQGGTAPVTLPSAAHSDTTYHFAGWYTAATGGTYVGAAGDEYEPSSDVELYAHYSRYYLRFENYGSAASQTYTGSGSMPIQGVDYAAGYNVNTCTMTPPDSSMKFVGWNTKEDGTGRWVLDGEQIGASDSTMTFVGDGSGGYCCTLYAQWSHLAGLTASQLAAGGVSAYGSYVGDVWIPVTENGDVDQTGFVSSASAASTSAISKALICTLVGSNHDGSGTLTFASQQLGGSTTTANWRSGNAQTGWVDSGTRTDMNSGIFFSKLPGSLKEEGC